MTVCYFTGVSGHPRPAVYIWHTPIGNKIPVCAECCAWWREDAAKGGSQQPVKIEQLAA